jgi:tRNA pseudouridine55 synthase
VTSSGLTIVDKPAGMTSHDVVAVIRKLAGTRRVGHAGTLDPMATGVLVVGVQQATRLLGYLTRHDKEYAATIRLGQATSTDDADGEIVTAAGAAGLTDDRLDRAVAALTGEITQVPPSVSAVKLGGQRAYRLARAGEQPHIPARTVEVRALSVLAVRRNVDLVNVDLVDVDVDVTCSSGTYIRALARDLGAALGTGGHLTALRRTRAGPYRADAARTLAQLAAAFELIPLADAAAAAFPRRDLTAAEEHTVAHGGRLAAAGHGPAPVAAFGPDGDLVALLTEQDDRARPLAVFRG